MQEKNNTKDVAPSQEIDEDYEKWLKDFVGAPTNEELNKMEKKIGVR